MRFHSLNEVCRHAGTILLIAFPAVGFAADGTGVATGGLDSGEMVAASLRMVAGLGVVLGLLVAAAWLSRRFRLPSRLRGSAIEVLSGISLGSREKVVLLRVGQEQLLVGISPGGMRTLHVLKDPAPAAFAEQLQEQLESR